MPARRTSRTASVTRSSRPSMPSTRASTRPTRSGRWTTSGSSGRSTRSGTWRRCSSRGPPDMAVLSTRVLMDFYHTGFVRPERNAELAARFPERIIPLGGVDPRAPTAVEEGERQITELGMKGFKWYTAEWRGESRGWKANDPAVFPCYEKALELGGRDHFFHKGRAVEPRSL